MKQLTGLFLLLPCLGYTLGGCATDNPDYIGISDGGGPVDMHHRAADLLRHVPVDLTACVPHSCAFQGKSCGPANDGCGGMLDCGNCPPPSTCGGGGTPSQCGGGFPLIPPTCQLLVSPGMGTLDTQFTVTLNSTDATACSISRDGNAASALPCMTTYKRSGKNFGGVGDHTAIVVATGKGGSTNCSAMWSISDPGNTPPTCTLTVDPARGSPDQTFTFTAMSMNATQCSASVDGGMSFPELCNAIAQHSGNEFGPGKHTVTLSAMGPGGMTQCSTNLVVQ